MICNICKVEKEKINFYSRYKTCKECVKEKQRARNKTDKLKKRS